MHINLGTILKHAFSLFMIREEFSYESLLRIYKKYIPTQIGTARRKDPFMSILPYEHKYVRGAIWSYKYRNNKRLATYFVQLMAPSVEKIAREMSASLLISVPSSPESNKKRGYDSNEYLAAQIVDTLNKRYGISMEHHKNILRKKSGITKQSRTKNRTERLRNPKGAFIVRKKNLIKDRNIILLDDVLTTGATTKEIKTMLKRAGAKQIHVVVLAH